MVSIDNGGAWSRAFDDVRMTPTTFLQGKRDHIVKRYQGEGDKALHALIEDLLSESA